MQEKGKVSKGRMRRVGRELRGLKKDLPLHFGSSIFVRQDQSRPYVMQVRVAFEAATQQYTIQIIQFKAHSTQQHITRHTTAHWR